MDDSWVGSSFCDTSACVQVKFKPVVDADPGVPVVTCLPDGSVTVAFSGSPEVKLVYTQDEWEQFRKGVQAGEFDLAVLRARSA